MKILAKRFDKTLPMPSYKTKGSVAFDLPARIDVEIPAKEVFYIPLNLALKLSENYYSVLVVRSSIHKLGIMSINHIGVIDSDYCGDEDELLLAAYNYTDHVVKIEKGTRVAQLLIQKFEPVEIEEVETLNSPSRGGFGTTGLK